MALMGWTDTNGGYKNRISTRPRLHGHRTLPPGACIRDTSPRMHLSRMDSAVRTDTFRLFTQR